MAKLLLSRQQTVQSETHSTMFETQEGEAPAEQKFTFIEDRSRRAMDGYQTLLLRSSRC